MPKGHHVTHTGKRPEGKVGQCSWMTSETVERHYKLGDVENEAHFGPSTSIYPPDGNSTL